MILDVKVALNPNTTNQLTFYTENIWRNVKKKFTSLYKDIVGIFHDWSYVFTIECQIAMFWQNNDGWVQHYSKCLYEV